MYSINYGGNELSKYIKVTNIKRSILPPRENYSVGLPKVHGSYYTGYKYGEREIEVEFAITTKTNEDYINFIRSFGDLLNVNVPTKLVLGDEPDKYYYAVPDGSTELDQILTTGSGSVVFLCHDPIAYSDEAKIFEGDAEGKVTIENNGTAETQPLINVAFTKNAQFLQCTYYTGETLLIGSRPDTDKPTTTPSDLVLHDPCEVATEWLPSGNVLDSGREVMGNVGVNTGGYGLVCNNYGSSSNGWHGGAVRRNFGTSVSEFEVVAKFEHNTVGSLRGNGSNATTPPSTSSKYTCTANPSLRIRSGRGTNYSKVGSIPYGKKDLVVTDIQKNWGKVTYGGKTGYVSMDYMKKQTSKSLRQLKETVYAEQQMGRLELYGFSTQNEKLFKFVIRDSEPLFEFTRPEIEIGSTEVLKDTSTLPKPNTEKVKDENGKETGEIKQIESGRFGSWNEFSGTFTIRRTKDAKGNFQWYAEVNKFENGKAVKALKTNTLSSSKYPTGDLSHVVVWFGQYKDSPVVDTMAITDLKVRRLSKPPTVPTNEIIFRNGDELEINCADNKVYLNGDLFMDRLDVGSEFFEVVKGSSQFRCLSDDPNIDVIATINEKWL